MWVYQKKVNTRKFTGGPTLAIEKQVGWFSITRFGVDRSQVVGSSPALARGLTVSEVLSVCRCSES